MSLATVAQALITEYFRFMAKNKSCHAYDQDDWEQFLQKSGVDFHSADWAMKKYQAAAEKSSTYGAQVNPKGLAHMFHHMFRGSPTSFGPNV